MRRSGVMNPPEAATDSRGMARWWSIEKENPEMEDPYAESCYASDFSVLRQFLHGAEQIIRLRQDGVFENRLVGYKRVGGGDAAHWSVKLIEELIGDAGGNLRAIAPTQRVFIGDERAIRFSDR